MRCPLSVAQCLSCLGDSSTHTGSTDSGEKPRIHTGKSRSKTRNANRQVGDFFFSKIVSVKWTVSLAVWRLLLIHYEYIDYREEVCEISEALNFFSVIYYYTCARLCCRSLNTCRLFKICLFLNWAPDHTDFAVDIQVQGERTIARFWGL